MTYLALDLETLGLEEHHAILTIGMAVFNEEFKELKSLHLSLAQPNNEYLVNPGALKVNKIDLVEHMETAKPYEHCFEEIKKFIRQAAVTGYDQEIQKAKISRLLVVGHSVQGDIRKLLKTFPDLPWIKYVHHAPMDTLILARFMKDCGKIPEECSLGLKNVLKVISPEFRFTAHEALSDARAAMELYKGIYEL